MTKNYVNHFETDCGIVVMFDDGDVKQLDSTSPFWTSVKVKLDNKQFDDLFSEMDLASRIKSYSNGLFHAVDGRVFIRQTELPDALGVILIKLAEQGLPVNPLISFWNNLMRNPSEESRQNLYGFLNANHVPITQDGCFLAYKRVDENYKDCYSHKFDNSIGAVVSMPRDQVDPNPDITCSKGLHVAAFDYANTFYQNGILVEIKINPEDVVAVPTDYNQQKMRVCQYEVLRECAGKREEILYTGDNEEFGDDWDDDEEFGDNWDDDDTNADQPVGFVDEDATRATVLKDARGRVAIPKSLVEQIGLCPNDHVVAISHLLGQVDVSPGDDAPHGNSTVYTVDKSSNIRVTKSMLAKAGLDSYTQFTLTVDGDCIRIT